MANYKFKINGKDFDVNVDGVKGNVAEVSVNGVNYSVELENQPAVAPVAAPVRSAAPSPKIPNVPVATHKAGGHEITSPLPGVVLHVEVGAGQSVKRGDRIAVIEAMKMENDVLAPVDGTITAVFVSKGDSVLEGAAIATIE